jgi:ActR/RegA family two-component response regulator
MDYRPTALVVERDARSRFVLRTALSQRGFRVVAARSRAEALDFMAGEGIGATPDLMLLDDPGTAGAYRVISLPNAGSEFVDVRLVGWRQCGAVPARLGDILTAVEEMTKSSVA